MKYGAMKVVFNQVEANVITALFMKPRNSRLYRKGNFCEETYICETIAGNKVNACTIKKSTGFFLRFRNPHSVMFWVFCCCTTC